MTRDDIIRMAREAGFDPHDMSADFTCNLTDIEHFAALVAAAERESITNMLMYMHNQAAAYHNYYKHAAIEMNRKPGEGEKI